MIIVIELVYVKFSQNKIIKYSLQSYLTYIYLKSSTLSTQRDAISGVFVLHSSVTQFHPILTTL